MYNILNILSITEKLEMKNNSIRIKRAKRPKYTLFICIVLFFIFSEKLNAQFGIKIGSTASSFYYTDTKPEPYQDFEIDLRPYLGYDIESIQTTDQKPLISPYIGVYYNLALTQQIGLRPELSFTQKGVNFSHTDYERIVYKVLISYLEFPLSVTYQFLQKEKSIGEFYFGGYAAYKINAVKKVASHNSSIEKTKLNSVKNFEGGLHSGVNYKHKFFNKIFFIDLRVFIGLNNIFEKPEDWTSIYYDTQKTKNTGINLSVGYEF